MVDQLRIVNRGQSQSLKWIFRKGLGWDDLWVNATVAANEFVDVTEQLARLLACHGARVVSVEVFGPIAFAEEGSTAIGKALENASLPVVWVDATSNIATERKMLSLSVWAAARASVVTCNLDGVAVGRVLESGSERICRLGPIQTQTCNTDDTDAPREIFARLDAALIGVGMTPRDICRTWFFIDGIVPLYDQFNVSRSLWFDRWGIVQFPASTAVNGRVLSGAKLTAGALATTGLSFWKGVSSPLQGDASAYGSSFSRAAEITLDGIQRIYVSGTASISSDGLTAYPGDTAAQTERTLSVVNSLLEAQDLSILDVVHCVAYVPEDSELSVITQLLEMSGCGSPWAIARAELCRPDLLVEVELEVLGKVDSGIILEPLTTILRPEDFETIPFEDATSLLDNAENLRDRAKALGYLFFPKFFSDEFLVPLRHFVRNYCEEHGWLIPDKDESPFFHAAQGACLIGRGWDDPRFVKLQTSIADNLNFQALCQSRSIINVLEILLGERVWSATANYCWLKFPGSPAQTTRPHQDSFYLPDVPNLWTAWVPLVDTPLQVGPLAIVPGSHCQGSWHHVNAMVGIDVPPETRWATQSVQAGDIVLFNAQAVHCAWSNVSATLIRVSLDIRYEPKPIDGVSKLRPVR